MRNNFITKDEMEHIAESVLEKADMPYKWQGIVTRTDIDRIIEFTYGLVISWENIDYLSPEEDVLAAIYPERKTIFLNESKEEFFEEKIGTMNFSKAHELGHWILHVTEQTDYEQLSFSKNDVYFCRCSSNGRQQETQADMFAASILMPRDIICGAVKK